MTKLLGDGIGAGLRILAPLLRRLPRSRACVGSVALGGFSFSFQALMPKFEKLNPIAGFKRIFGWHGIAELAKSLAKFLLVAAVAYALVLHLERDFLALGTLTLRAALQRSAWLSAVCLVSLSATLVLIAAVDVPFQYWQHRRQLKMTKQETKDEQKETEGRPEVRSRAASAAARDRAAANDGRRAEGRLVAVNPTHYAVALRYDAAKMKAPRVVAKGADLVALNIRRIAEAHNVPIYEDPQFTRALYYTSEIGQEIPAASVRRGRAGAHLHLPAHGPHVAGGKRPNGPAKPQTLKKPEIAIDPSCSSRAAAECAGMRCARDHCHSHHATAHRRRPPRPRRAAAHRRAARDGGAAAAAARCSTRSSRSTSRCR